MLDYYIEITIVYVFIWNTLYGQNAAKVPESPRAMWWGQVKHFFFYLSDLTEEVLEYEESERMSSDLLKEIQIKDQVTAHVVDTYRSSHKQYEQKPADPDGGGGSGARDTTVAAQRESERLHWGKSSLRKANTRSFSASHLEFDGV